MKSLEEYIALAEQAHGHLCAGQILGVRMALCGLSQTNIEDPARADRKRLIRFVEIDRCATDAIAVVTRCRLGKRALKFRDFGYKTPRIACEEFGVGINFERQAATVREWSRLVCASE